MALNRKRTNLSIQNMRQAIEKHIEEKEAFHLLKDMRNYLAFYPETLVIDTYVNGAKTESNSPGSLATLEQVAKATSEKYRQFRSMARPKDENQPL